jgi:inosose dehydratase
MDRRQFIKNAAFTSVIIAGGAKLAACASKTKSVTNVRWSMGWILWRDFKNANISISEAIKNMSDLGLDGIEFTPRKDELSKFGFTRESFRDLLTEKKLSVTGNYFRGDFYDPEKHDEILSNFNNTLENLKFYGAKNVIIEPPGRGGWVDQNYASGGGNESEIPDKIKAMAPFLSKLGKIANDSGIEIGLHPHLNTIVENPAEIDMFMELTDPNYVGIVPDTGHIQLGGGNPVEIIRKYSSRVCYFHLKDVTGTFERPNFGPNIRELGNGEVDFQEVMKVLKEIEYKGWINVEQDYTVMTPLESATESMGYINKIMKPIYT